MIEEFAEGRHAPPPGGLDINAEVGSSAVR
jgi:hypothetical protein